MGLYLSLIPGHATVTFYSTFHMVHNYDSYIAAWTADLELCSQKTFSLHHTQSVFCFTPHAHQCQAQHSQSQFGFGVPQLGEGQSTDQSHISCSNTLTYWLSVPSPHPIRFVSSFDTHDSSQPVQDMLYFIQLIGFSELHSQLLRTPTHFSIPFYVIKQVRWVIFPP